MTETVILNKLVMCVKQEYKVLHFSATWVIYDIYVYSKGLKYNISIFLMT